jgi:hypothetical protein
MNNMINTIGELTQTTHYMQTIFNPNQSQNERSSIQPTSSKRYRFTDSPQEDMLVLLFTEAMDKNSEKVIQAAEKDSQSTFYPKWKSLCLIDIPKKIHSICSKNKIIQLALLCSSVPLALFATIKTFSYITDLTATSLPIIRPVIINNTPLILIKLFNKAQDARKCLQVFLMKHTWKIFWINVGLDCITRKLPTESYFKRIVKKLNIINNILYRLTCSSEIWESTFSLFKNIFVKIIWIYFNALDLLKILAKSINHEKQIICAKKALNLWRTTIKNRLHPIQVPA